MVADKPLGRYFRLYELLESDTATRNGLEAFQFNPPMGVVDNLTRLGNVTLDPIRISLGVPVFVPSGYRCNRVNTIVKGSANSQHLVGEAADLKLSYEFMSEAHLAHRATLRGMAFEILGIPDTGKHWTPNFYLFVHVVLNLDALDIDQVIHEFGEPGAPAWVHVASSTRQNKRQIILWGKGGKKMVSVKEALALGA
jgi:hypothetical protein